MSNETTISLTITTDAAGALAGLKQVQDQAQKIETTINQGFQNIKAAWVNAAAGLSVLTTGFSMAQSAYQKVTEYMKEAAQALQVERAFRETARQIGFDAEKMVQDLQRVTNNTIDDSDLMQRAFKAITGGLDPDKVVSVAEISRVAARRMNVDVSTAFTDIANAVETGQMRQLKSYGLLTKQQIEWIDKIKASGKEVDTFKIIMTNAAAQAEYLGQVQENESEILQQHAVTWKQLKEEIGKWIWTIYSGKDLVKEGTDSMINDITELELAAIGQGGHYGKGVAYDDPRGDEARRQKEEQDRKLKAQAEAQLAVTLRQAQLEFKKSVDALNPSLGEEARQLQQIDDRAAMLKDKLTEKNLPTSWIAAEVERAKEYIRQTIEMERAMKQLSEAAKREDARNKSAYEDEKTREQMKTKAFADQLNATERLTAYQVKFNEVSAGQSEAVRYENNLALLKAQADEKLRLIDIQLQYAWETEEGEREGNRLALEYLRLQEQIAEAESLRYYSEKEVYLLELQQERELLNITIQRNEYQRSIWENQWAGIMATANNIGGEAGKGAGMMVAGMKGVADIYAGKDQYTKEYERAQQHYNDMEKLHAQNRIGQMQAQEEYEQLMLQKEQMYSNQKYAMVSNTFGAMAGAAYAFYNMTAQQSKAAFIAYQAFAAAEAAIAGIKATINAYEWGNKFGGPPLGAAMAAIAAATSAMYVAAILSQSPPSGNATAVAPASSGGYDYNQPTVPTWEQQPEQKAAPIINIIIQGNLIDNDQYARELIPSLKKAIEDGAEL